jgi:hypothetical protein
VARYLVDMRVFGSMRRANQFSLFVDDMYGHSDWKLLENVLYCVSRR